VFGETSQSDAPVDVTSMLSNYAPVGERNKCGCSNFCVKVMIGVTIFLAILFIIIGFAAQVGALFFVGVISIIISIVGCNILCCPCLQNPKDGEE
jgi:nucleoside permease NupC